MKYMLLIYGNDETWAQMEAVGMDAVYARHRELVAELEATGELVATQGLTTVDARVVRVQGGVPVVTDGPFTEAKELLAGLLPGRLLAGAGGGARREVARGGLVTDRGASGDGRSDSGMSGFGRDLPASARRWDLRPASH